MHVDALKHAYTSNDAVRAICDELASRQRNQNETKLLRMLSLLDNKGVSIRKPALIAGFRDLESAGCGKYMEGSPRMAITICLVCSDDERVQNCAGRRHRRTRAR